MAYVYVSYGGVTDALSDSTNCCLGPTSYIVPHVTERVLEKRRGCALTLFPEMHAELDYSIIICET